MKKNKNLSNFMKKNYRKNAHLHQILKMQNRLKSEH